jgi:uroporphyrin-III C-methyltransferase / precorrin-2 dehydrogenase / sirohydrochlorin ferrochelatase
LNGLPVLIRLTGRPVILLGSGEAADAKRRLIERAGGRVVGADDDDARIAIVAIDDEAVALAAIASLRARGILVNAVDRPDHCDFTLPAIVDRSPVLVAISTGGASAGLAAALRQRFEALLPDRLGALADALYAARGSMRERWPDAAGRRRALGAALASSGPLDPITADADAVAHWLDGNAPASPDRIEQVTLQSPDPDDLTLRTARLLAQADTVVHHADVPPAILDRARADAVRIAGDGVPDPAPPGLTILLERTR